MNVLWAVLLIVGWIIEQLNLWIAVLIPVAAILAILYVSSI